MDGTAYQRAVDTFGLTAAQERMLEELILADAADSPNYKAIYSNNFSPEVLNALGQYHDEAFEEEPACFVEDAPYDTVDFFFAAQSDDAWAPA